VRVRPFGAHSHNLFRIAIYKYFIYLSEVYGLMNIQGN
jgi:hypothetical protein